MTQEEISQNRVLARNLYNEALVENSLVKLERAKALWVSAKRWEAYLSARAVDEAAIAPSYSLTNEEETEVTKTPEVEATPNRTVCERFIRKGTLGVLIKLWCTTLSRSCTGCLGPKPVMKWS